MRAGAGVCTGVGKSCLLLRFSEDSFQTSFITTIGQYIQKPATICMVLNTATA